MKIPKATDEDKDSFRSVVPDAATVEVRPMFGNVAAFVNGKMFMGLFGPDVGLRLSAPDREELLGEDGAGPFGPEGRPMQEYVALPFAWRDDAESTERWVSRALDHTAGLPPKGRCTLSHPWGRDLVLPATDCCPIGWGHVQINQDLALPRIAGNNRRVRSGRASVCSQDQRIPPAVTSQPGSLRYGSGRGGSSLAAAARRPRDPVAASFRMSHRTAAARRR